MAVRDSAAYVIVRISGRGQRIYHLIADDGSTPLCGVRLSDRHWTIGYKKVGTRLCAQCQERRDDER